MTYTNEQIEAMIDKLDGYGIQHVLKMESAEQCAHMLRTWLAERKKMVVLQWRDGAPNHPWDKEWFIAETTYGDRVVLKALPKEFTYDFRTSDETYINREKIKRWMQFPDSDFVEPPPTRAAWIDIEAFIPNWSEFWLSRDNNKASHDYNAFVLAYEYVRAALEAALKEIQK